MIHDYVENLLSDEMNKSIIDFVRFLPNWTMEPKYGTEELGETKDAGVSIRCYTELEPFNGSPQILFLSQIILNAFLYKTKNTYKNVELKRSYVNYYNQSSHCPMHVDGELGAKEASLLVFLDSSKESFTQIKDEKFYSKSGAAVAFDSSDEHFATGAIEDSSRYTLNIMFTYDEMKYNA